MRVCHLITRLIVGGAQENTLDSVLGLRQLPEFDVSLIAGPTHGPEGSLEERARAVPGLLTLARHLVRPLSPWHDALAVAELIRLLRQRRPDLVHTHSGKAGILGRLAARRLRIPIIVHGIHGPSFGPWQGPVANFLFRTAERVAARWTTHFVSVAQAMSAQYLAAGIGRPEMYSRIFSGFDLRPYLELPPPPAEACRRRWGLGSEHFVVGKIARFFKLKGHPDLFAAAPGLIRRCPRIRFLLVGDGAWRERFERQAGQPGLAGHFIFTGLVPPEEVPTMIGAMDVLVHLSRREGLPRALPQALAGGRPVVAWDCDGAGEVCLSDQTGFLLPLGDLKGLEEALLRLEADPALRRRLGQSGRQWVRCHFGLETMVAALAELYRRLAREVGLVA